MNNIVQINKNIPAALRAVLGDEINDDLSAGIKSSFGIVSIRGGTWKIKYDGDEEPILNEDGDPQPGLEVVIVKSAPNISKIFYEEGYTEGSDAAPTCFSNEGIVPDPESENPQASSCAACPQNAWGSRITDSNKKAKACADSRRIAVAPADDIANEVMGGPMLLRVPAASLKDLAAFGKAVARKGTHYQAIVIRLSFDPEAAYPKLRYKAVRKLTDDEGEQIAEHLANTDLLDGILGLAPSQPVQVAVPKEADNSNVDAEFEEPIETVKPKKKAVAKKKVAPKKKVVAKAEPKGEGEGVKADDLDDILAGLDLD